MSVHDPLAAFTALAGFIVGILLSRGALIVAVFDCGWCMGRMGWALKQSRKMFARILREGL